MHTGQLMVSPPSCAAKWLLRFLRKAWNIPSRPPREPLSVSPTGDQQQLKNVLGSCEASPGSLLQERRGPWRRAAPTPSGTLTLPSVVQRTARSPAVTSWLCLCWTDSFPSLLCSVSSSLLCVTQLERARFRVACMNSFILILNRFPTFLRLGGLGHFSKMQATMKNNH